MADNKSKYRYATVTEQNKRELNEDAYLFVSKRNEKDAVCYLAVISDGMGGTDAGELASGFIVESLKRWFEKNSMDLFEKDTDEIKMILHEQICDIHEAIVAAAEEKGSSMGATLTAFLAIDKVYIIAHVGDSRAYILSNDKLVKKTKDQTEAQNYMDNGATLTNEEFAKMQNHLLQCIGMGTMMPAYYEGTLSEQYSILLCSDGMYHKLSLDNIEDVLKKKISGKKMLQELACMAMERGEKDNITGVLVYKS